VGYDVTLTANFDQTAGTSMRFFFGGSRYVEEAKAEPFALELLERRDHGRAEVGWREARDRADDHHAAVGVELAEERRHVRTADDVDDDVVAGVALAGAVEHLGRAEVPEASATLW
jgi:hypothetical protein